MLAVHGRRREKKHHQGIANLNVIRVIKQHYRQRHGLSIPIISNGNITSRQDANHNLKFTKCDGAMSAYGLLRNPYLFDPKRASKPCSDSKYNVSPESGIAASWEYLEFFREFALSQIEDIREIPSPMASW